MSKNVAGAGTSFIITAVTASLNLAPLCPYKVAPIESFRTDAIVKETRPVIVVNIVELPRRQGLQS
jgi:hypothetical protein